MGASLFGTATANVSLTLSAVSILVSGVVAWRQHLISLRQLEIEEDRHAEADLSVRDVEDDGLGTWTFKVHNSGTGAASDITVWARDESDNTIFRTHVTDVLSPGWHTTVRVSATPTDEPVTINFQYTDQRNPLGKNQSDGPWTMH